MGHMHKYIMHCCKKQSADFIYCCCWAVIVRYVVGPSSFTDSILVSKTVFKNVCVAGMAVRLNMSLASLCSHVHKSTYNDCKPKTHHPEKSTAAHPNCTIRSTSAGGAQVSSSLRDDAQDLTKAVAVWLYCIAFIAKYIYDLQWTCCIYVKNIQLQYLTCASLCLFWEMKKKQVSGLLVSFERKDQMCEKTNELKHIGFLVIIH